MGTMIMMMVEEEDGGDSSLIVVAISMLMFFFLLLGFSFNFIHFFILIAGCCYSRWRLACCCSIYS